MSRSKNIYDRFSIWSPHKRISYAINGAIMGLGAPLGWLFLDLIFFRPSELSIPLFLLQEMTQSPQKIVMFLYMFLGTSVIMSVTGYLVGRGFDWNEDKTVQINNVRKNIEEQKEEFEQRFHTLHSDMTNLYRIGAEIQKSLTPDQVLGLIAQGAHHVLRFDRVNIFLLDKEKKRLICKEASGHEGMEWRKIEIPLTDNGGILTKTIEENEVFLIKDIATLPQGYRLDSPFDQIPELRSSSFACIPLRERGEAIGLIAVDNKYRKTCIRDENLSTLQILADQGSVALTNISLFHGVNDLHQELEQNFKVLLNHKKQFSEIVGELSQRAGGISKKIQHVAQSSVGLSGTVNDTASSVHEMSSSLNAVAEGVKSLFEEAEKTVSATTQMTSSLHSVEDSSKESHVLSEQVKKDAEEGVSLVKESIQGVSKIQNMVMESVEVMNQFVNKTEKIGEVLEVINHINEKTHVLSLNAAIISSQAGEHGKGFEVVSNEIRALAEQTAVSSKEIENMIESLQREVREAVSIIQSIPKYVDAGVQLSKKSGEALQQILKSAMSSLDMTQQIEKATGEQVKSTESVWQAFGRVNDMIQKMSRSIEEQNQGSQVIARANENMRNLTSEVAQATHEQSDEFQVITEMIQEVSKMVDSLFFEAEKRRQESEAIIQGIDLLEQKGLMA